MLKEQEEEEEEGRGSREKSLHSPLLLLSSRSLLSVSALF